MRTHANKRWEQEKEREEGKEVERSLGMSLVSDDSRTLGDTSNRLWPWASSGWKSRLEKVILGRG